MWDVGVEMDDAIAGEDWKRVMGGWMEEENGEEGKEGESACQKVR